MFVLCLFRALSARRSYAFVKFVDPEAVEAAVTAMNNYEYAEHVLRVVRCVAPLSHDDDRC